LGLISLIKFGTKKPGRSQSYSGKSDEKIAEDLCVELSHVRNVKSKITKKIKNDNIGNFVIELVKNSQPDFIISS
jgi:DNA-binding NarL/FixJ family response regulator